MAKEPKGAVLAGEDPPCRTRARIDPAAPRCTAVGTVRSGRGRIPSQAQLMLTRAARIEGRLIARLSSSRAQRPGSSLSPVPLSERHADADPALRWRDRSTRVVAAHPLPTFALPSLTNCAALSVPAPVTLRLHPDPRPVAPVPRSMADACDHAARPRRRRLRGQTP